MDSHINLSRYLLPRWFVSLYYFFRYRAFISVQSYVQLSSRICFGKGTTVKPFSVIQTGTGAITFGSNVAVNNFVQIASAEGEINIGNNVRIGPHVTILGSSRNFQRRDELICNQGYLNDGITIESDVLIGAGAVILNGCRVSEGVVIGAGSIVNKDIAPYSVVAGAPIKTLRSRT